METRSSEAEAGGGPQALLVAALCRARARFGPVRKDAHYELRPGVRIAYAPLETVLDAVATPLAEEGLVVTQTLVPGDGCWLQQTALRHVGGGELLSVVPVLLPERAPNMMQALGGAITYSRRYGLLSLLGLAAEDDDAVSAAGGGERRTEGRRDGAEHARRAEGAPDRRETPAQAGRRQAREWPEGYPRHLDRFVAAAVEKWNAAWHRECANADLAADWSESDNLTSTHRLTNGLATLAIEAELIEAGSIETTGADGTSRVRDRHRTQSALAELYERDPKAVGRLARTYRDRRLAEERARVFESGAEAAEHPGDRRAAG
jgi:hypothetical protein